MVWNSELEGEWILGSLITPAGARPFRLELGTGVLVLDDFVGGARPRRFDPAEREEIEALVRLATDLEVTEIRLGEYLCHTCGRWCEASQAQWSVGLCLSCSMDRDSDRWS